jgi:glycerol-3-phosphate dehydrogenase
MIPHSAIEPGSAGSRLTRARRARDRDWLAAGNAVDVLVVGGGIVGVGVALDAITRGLTVALVERHDLAFGTSRWSSKLAHGGLRYLAKAQVGVAWESAVERDILATRIAPHLVRPIAQLLPLMTTTPAQQALAMQVGLMGGDALRRGAGTPSTLLPSPRRVDAAYALGVAPTLDASTLRGGLLSYDCALEDDARLVVGVARTAAALGALVLTRTEVVAAGGGGAHVRDRLDNGEYEIKARWVVNATGVDAGRLDPSIKLRPSRGSHAVLRSASLGNPTASMTVPVPNHFGRFVFTVPQPEGWVLAGITDEAVDDSPEVPVPDESEIGWILSTLSTALSRPLTNADVIGRFAGIRPLVDDSDDDESSADISRRHLVQQSDSGVVTVTGGKLTTYRRMAQDALDLITEMPCVTTGVALVGVDETVEKDTRLNRRFGAEGAIVAELAQMSSLFAEPVAIGAPVIGAEIAWAVLSEGALDSADIIERRTRLSLVDEWGVAAFERVAEILAQVSQ